MKFGEEWYNLGFITIIDKKANMGTGTSGWLENPSGTLKELENGNELDQVTNEIIGIVGVQKPRWCNRDIQKEKFTEENCTNMAYSCR